MTEGRPENDRTGVSREKLQSAGSGLWNGLAYWLNEWIQEGR